MTAPTWRDLARARIAEVIAANPAAGGEKLGELLREAYPFGERRWHPYKVWLTEVDKACQDLTVAGNLRTFWTRGRG